MKFIKQTLCTIAVLAMAFLHTTAANAAAIGYIDIGKVLKNYTYFQQVNTDITNRKIEIQKFTTDARQKVNDAKTPVDRKNLEDRYARELETRIDSFQNYQISKQKEIEDNMLKAVQIVAKEQKLDAVLTNDVLLYGGVDISGNVVLKLNSMKK